MAMTREELIEALEKAEVPIRELDAEIMFECFAKPIGKKDDGGPMGYLWPEDNPSWSFGIRFPGRDRAWFNTTRARKRDGETLLIERDGALVLMNDLRIPKLTASIDAALTLVPEGWRCTHAYSGPPVSAFVLMRDEPRIDRGHDAVEGNHALWPIAIVIAALKARAQ